MEYWLIRDILCKGVRQRIADFIRCRCIERQRERSRPAGFGRDSMRPRSRRSASSLWPRGRPPWLPNRPHPSSRRSCRLSSPAADMASTSAFFRSSSQSSSLVPSLMSHDANAFVVLPTEKKVRSGALLDLLTRAIGTGEETPDAQSEAEEEAEDARRAHREAARAGLIIRLS